MVATPTPKHPSIAEFDDAIKRAAQAYIELLPSMGVLTEAYVNAFKTLALAFAECQKQIDEARHAYPVDTHTH